MPWHHWLAHLSSSMFCWRANNRLPNSISILPPDKGNPCLVDVPLATVIKWSFPSALNYNVMSGRRYSSVARQSFLLADNKLSFRISKDDLLRCKRWPIAKWMLTFWMKVAFGLFLNPIGHSVASRHSILTASLPVIYYLLIGVLLAFMS